MKFKVSRSNQKKLTCMSLKVLGSHIDLSEEYDLECGIFETFLLLALTMEALMAEGCQLIVIRVKDRYNNPTDFGYTDMLVNVKLEGSDHIGELQLHLKEMRVSVYASVCVRHERAASE